MGEIDENTVPESNALLTEILGVLKRIDGHLEAQESRISLLDAKVTALTSSASTNESQISNTRTESQRPVDGRTSTATSRKHSFPSTLPTTRPRDLRLEIVDRTDNFGGRGLRGSVASYESRWGSPGPKKLDSGRNSPWGSINKGVTSSPKPAVISRTGTWHSIPPPPTTAESEHIEVDDDPAYSKFPPPQEWIITRSLGRTLDVKYSSAEARALWTKYVGDSWTIPPDGRIEMTFQQHLLERLDKGKVSHLLQTLSDVSNKLEYQHPSDFSKRGSFRVTDFGFDPSFEESVAEYRAEVLTGKYRKHHVSNPGKRLNVSKPQTAPWKRMM